MTFVKWLVAWQQDSQISCSISNSEDHVTTTRTVNPHHGKLYVAFTGAGCAQDVYICVCVPTRHTHNAVLRGSALNAVLLHGHGYFI
jgi:hypothetical protein